VSLYGRTIATRTMTSSRTSARRPKTMSLTSRCLIIPDGSGYPFHGQAAWDAALNTVNIGKYNLGLASIGICSTPLRGDSSRATAACMAWRDGFSPRPAHVIRGLRALVAMKLFALRAADYLRSPRRMTGAYLLYNPVVKMKVTTQGEEVINLLWDVIAAKGFGKGCIL